MSKERMKEIEERVLVDKVYYKYIVYGVDEVIESVFEGHE